MDKTNHRLEYIIQRILFIIFSIGILCLIIFVGLSIFFLSPVDSNHDDYTEFQIESGWGKARIASELEEAGLIRSSFFFKFFMFVNNRDLYAGTYQLSQSMSVYDIINVLNSMNSLENESTTVIFVEGKRITDYARRIANNFDFTEEEVLERLADHEFLESLINRYWFLTNEILNEEIKYPLEGYLFPDTYIFKLNSSIDDIIIKMLSTMEQRLEVFKEDINLSPYSVHQLLTLASIVELEVPKADERVAVAGLFYNRLASNTPLGADVTTHYAVQTELTEPLTRAQLNTQSPYNTRGIYAVTGIPIGPIASPSLASITAAIEPDDNDYMFFITDINMKVYYTETYAEHERLIDQLRSDGLWHD